MALLDRPSEQGDRFQGGGPGSACAPPPADGASDRETTAPSNGAPARTVMPPVGHARPRTYEELDGAEGRAVFFRPHRFTAADLAPLRAAVGVTIAGTPRECALRDVSQNGVAFAWPMDTPLLQGEALRITLRFDGQEVWHGDAHVTSVRGQEGLVAASFDSTLFDTDELQQLRVVSELGVDGSLRARSKPWFAAGHEPFKALVGEMRLLLEDTEARLAEFEKGLPWHVLQDPASQARIALVQRLHAEIGVDLLALAAEIDAALRHADPHDGPALEEFSHRQVDRFFMQTPWMYRARHKPFGYPGDYEVMNFFYEKDFEGPTLFARMIGHTFIHTPVALAVRGRKDLMRRQLRAVLERRAGSSRTVRFLSIASGPARELQELLAEIDELPAPLEIVLFDQDKGALGHAYRRLRPLVDARFPGRVRLVFLNESIKRLLRDRCLFDEFKGFDAVYSCGLFDYLREAIAVRLARNLYAAAAPGGLVFIGNMVDHHNRWVMEHHLDWALLYRTREELVEIGRGAAPQARIRVLEEETGVNPFIELVRD